MNVRRLRVAAGLSQEAFAVDAGLDRTYIRRIERNLENPSVSAHEKIIRALVADIGDLLVIASAGRGRSRPCGRGARSRNRVAKAIRRSGTTCTWRAQ